MNDPELQSKGKYLGEITQDFVKVADMIREASYQLRVRKISDYPVFPISRVSIQIGELLYEKEKFDTKWNFYFTYLEQLMESKLITEELSQTFIEAYKDADEFCCVLVVEPDFTNIVFIPYPED